ncbi:uncharacterized protein LOC135496935 isoform X2 [Lineus longissimus]|uniref:uncharacterized protein LOC135496935 isoform X2 n=1 Tax=Lineus longissimus TaxID=88925 RepID=UPI002B4FA179
MDVRIVVCLAFLAAAANCKEQRGPPWISFESGCDNPDFTKISQSLNRDAKEDWVKHKKQGVNCATIFKCDGSKADGKVCLSRDERKAAKMHGYADDNGRLDDKIKKIYGMWR